MAENFSPLRHPKQTLCLYILLGILLFATAGAAQQSDASPVSTGATSSLLTKVLELVIDPVKVTVLLILMAISGWLVARIRLAAHKQQLTAARLQTDMAREQAEVAQREKAEVERQVEAAQREKADVEREVEAAQREMQAAKAVAASVQLEKDQQEQQKTTLERESVEEMEKKTDEAKDPSEEKWQKLFVHEIRISADVAKAMIGPSKVIVVASGKGGVGKSTISLGLLEYYSRTGPTLLVDFDMPNRGLTSLLRTDDGKYVDVLSELTRFSALPKFREMFPDSRIARDERTVPASSNAGDPSQPSSASATKAADDERKRLIRNFKDLADAFVDTDIGMRDFPVRRFDGDLHIPIKGETAVISATNCFFMPSVRLGDLFLSSPVFDATFSEVFYFIRCLSYWALRKEKIGTIILDCHGAHDLFMVGAIHAATDLVVVMTPDPGSFDGTYDLLAFAERLNKKSTSFPAPIALVINNCRDWQEASMQVIKQFFKDKSPIKPGVIVGVKAAEDIRLVGSKYKLGRASQSQLWQSILDLGNFFNRPNARAEDPAQEPSIEDPRSAGKSPGEPGDLDKTPKNRKRDSTEQP